MPMSKADFIALANALADFVGRKQLKPRDFVPGDDGSGADLGAGEEMCDLCMTSGVTSDRTTFCGKVIGIECGCNKPAEDGSDATCSDADCEACQLGMAAATAATGEGTATEATEAEVRPKTSLGIVWSPAAILATKRAAVMVAVMWDDLRDIEGKYGVQFDGTMEMLETLAASLDCPPSVKPSVKQLSDRDIVEALDAMKVR